MAAPSANRGGAEARPRCPAPRAVTTIPRAPRSGAGELRWDACVKLAGSCSPAVRAGARPRLER